MTASRDRSAKIREGYIEIWINYFFRFKKRWVVIKDGQMSYYKSESEKSYVSLGTVNLEKATIAPYKKYIITIDCGGIKTIYLYALSTDNRDKWIAKREAKDRAEEGRRIKKSLAASAQNQRRLETDLGEVNKGKDQVIKDTQKLNTAMAQVEQASDAAEAMSHFNTVRQRSQALGASSKKMVEKSKNFCERSKSQMNHLESVAKHSLQLWLHHQEKRDQEMQDLQNRMQNMESELRRNTSSRMADGESDSDSGAETEGL